MKLSHIIFATALFFGLANLAAYGDDGLRALPQALLALANTWAQTQQFGANGQGYVTLGSGSGVGAGVVSIYNNSNSRVGFLGFSNAELALETNANGTPVSFYGANGGTLFGQATQNGFVVPKLSAAPSTAPGASKTQVYAVAGTNTGTCKLQIMAGTSTTPITIVDNVGAGC